MTAVQCDVCSHRITNEADRIFCFGGCEQIYHSKCCDLSVSAVSAVKTNIALKYFCFECRKKLTSLNDILLKCTDLFLKVDKLEASVTASESKLNLAMKEQLDVFENRLLSVVQKSIDNVKSSATVAARSYADVAGMNDVSTVQNAAKVPTQQARTTTTGSDAPDTLAGSLRSGRKRVIGSPKPPANKPSSAAAVISIGSSKPKQLMIFEQTVVFKPKQTQSVDVTKRDVRSKFNPINYAVKDVRYRDNGEVIVRCDSNELANDMVRVARESLSDKYDVDTQKPLRPRVKIVGITEKPHNLVDQLKKQNRLPELAELKLLRINEVNNTSDKSFTAFFECNAVAFDSLMKSRYVYIEWERCQVYEVVDAMRCFKCSKFGHKSSSCRNAFCCPKCSGEHNVRDCPSQIEVCINCKEQNRLRKQNEEPLDAAHAAWSRNCPFNKKRLKLAKQRIDYTS